MISKVNTSITNDQKPVDDNSITLETASGDILAKHIVASDVFVWDSSRNAETHGLFAAEVKSVRNMEANLRRIQIDRDLDQPDMASAKTYLDQSDQDIVNAFNKETEKKSEA
jgi:hypothetical protein